MQIKMYTQEGYHLSRRTCHTYSAKPENVLGKVVGEHNIPGRDWGIQMPKIEKGFVPFKK